MRIPIKYFVFSFLFSTLSNVYCQNTTLKNNLYRAIESSNTTQAISIIESGYDINKVFNLEIDYRFHGLTPLLAACEMHNEEIANYLIIKGADINYKPNLPNKACNTYYAIDLAIINNMHSTSVLLLENNADVNHLMPNGCENEGITPLHLALINNDVKLAKQLIESGADVNIKTLEDSKTALHYLSFYKPDIELAELMLKNDGDINAKDKYGNTPLHIAIEWNSSADYVSCLLKNGAKTKLKNKDKKTAYDIALEYSKTQFIELFK